MRLAQYHTIRKQSPFRGETNQINTRSYIVDDRGIIGFPPNAVNPLLFRVNNPNRLSS